jgi:hypothetical protein
MPVFEQLLAELLRRPLNRAKLDVQADELARVIVFGIQGFKDIARDGAEMRRLIGAQVAVVVAAKGFRSHVPAACRMPAPDSTGDTNQLRFLD